MVTRVSTFGLSQTMMASSLAVQSKHAEALTQQSSGLVTSTYGGLGTSASSLISAETTMTQLTTWQDNTKIADDRVQSMYSAIDTMIDQLTTLRSTITAAKSTSYDNTTLNSTGTSLLEDLSDQMNTRMDGRYLFAGSNTDTAPVDTTQLTAVTSVPSSADTSYYTGDSEVSSVRISANQTIAYGVTANGSGFEQALRAANIIANMTTSPVDSDALDEAYDLATKAIDALTATQSALSTSSSRLESAESRQTSAIGLLETTISDTKNVDTAEIAVKVSSYETQLEASYSALAKVSSFSLVKYL